MAFLPDWFDEGGFTDTEAALVDFFQWLLGAKVFVCTWLPPGYYTPTTDPIGGTEPTLRIWRQPGKFDSSSRVDESLIQIAAIARTRADAWQLIEFVRRMMDPLVFELFPIPRKDGSVTKFSCADEWLGPQQIPEGIIDDKFIPVTYKLPIRERRNLPPYRQIMTNLLPT